MIDTALLQNILRLQEPEGALAFRPDTEAPGEDRIVEANNAACALFGCSREAILGHTLSSLLSEVPPPADTDGGTPVEGRLTTCNGDAFAAELRCHPLQMGPETLKVLTIRDISLRKQRERKSALDERLLRLHYDFSKKMDETEQDIIQFALNQCVEITGSRIGYLGLLNELETELVIRAWAGESINECQVKPRSVTFKVSQGGLWSETIRQRRPIITNDYSACRDKLGLPGKHIPLKRILSLPTMENGQVKLVVSVGNKDEEYTDSDVAQISLLMEGVSRVIERKRMESDLIKAIKTAEKASRAKSQFLANMSHELRTPLNGIMGMTQILLGTEITDEQKEYLSLSLDACMHLAKVMTSLLDLSSIESGGVSLAPVNFNLPDTIESVVKPLVIQAEQKHLELTCRLAPDIPVEVYGDVDKFRQILINLIFNAIKFTEKGTVSVEVGRAATGPLGDSAQLCFTVTDSGIGIPENRQESIFESFTLGENYLTKRYGGMGLGLSISKKLTALMGGTIELRSELGRGSTFTLTLPFLMQENQGGSCILTVPGKIGDDLPLSVLVAEDEKVNALVTSRLLKKSGHRATVVGNGQHAIDALMRERYDVVLMDVQMPVINGLQVTEIIRSGAAEGICSDTPIIGLTAFAGETDRQRFLDAGMNDVVTKPFEAADLLGTIRRVLTP